ncbi:MAG: hypothetical protein F4Y01_06105 [Gammaproteobacteria bacterium]|nr:hypothetical protein [Gammaproteobacteria bacterium]
MSKNTPMGAIPIPFGADGSPPGEDWQEVRDAETGELLAYGRRIDAREAERLGEAMHAAGGVRTGRGPGASRGPGRSPARGRTGAPEDAALLFGGKPMPAGHFHFALPLPTNPHAPDGNGDSGCLEPDLDPDGDDLRAERSKARHEQKEQRHRDKMREREAKVIRNARSERKAHKKAETKRKRLRSGKRSLNRRR